MDWKSTLRRLLWVGLIAAFTLPVGEIIFPFVADEIGDLWFATIEATVSATLGFGLFEMFG
jgi:hypothetical protein